jgi:Putative lumazine-binding
MRTRIVTAVFLLSFSLLIGSALAATDSTGSKADAKDLAAVEKVAGWYLESGKTGEVDLLRQAFHPSARLQFVREGQYTEWSGSDYIDGRKEGRKSDHRTQILSVDVAGSAALAKVELEYERVRFVDYLSLLKIDGRWWIVNKSFHRYDK